ncbi:MAG: class I SAM-dependent methyltransferase [Gemmatales bacterium]|nr:class I SAM-dependent methyltransferase [Gemmatales bacterium]MDW8174444.1 class I SAM-dependent methyltransferase [Gemmatales bacterium]
MLHGDALSVTAGASLQRAESRQDLPSLPVLSWTPEQAQAWFCQEALTTPPADLAEPLTLSWFLALEYHRHHRQGRWLMQALEFTQHRGETVIAVGCGLGTDWVQYARHGARVVVCCPDAEELIIARHHFALRGLGGIFLHAPQPPLTLPDAFADLVCLNEMLANQGWAPQWLGEVHRLLKPGGKLLLIERLPVGCYWAGQRLARRILPLLSAFEDVRYRRYHLRRCELPWYWRWLPRRWLERFLGRFLLIKACKPVLHVNLLAQAA